MDSSNPSSDRAEQVGVSIGGTAVSGSAVCPTNQFIGHPAQSIMSRTGSFPLRVAYDLLKQHAGSSAVILDPFCGKGTSLLAARTLGFSAYGTDVAPEAVICAAAKLADVSWDTALHYLSSLQLESSLSYSAPRRVRAFFHPSTLSQILEAKRAFVNDMRSADPEVRGNGVFGLAVLLGILHGHASYSLSLPSAHAYSMAAGYVSRYAKAHGLKKPKRDVQECLIAKAYRCLAVPLPKPVQSAVRLASAFDVAKVFPELVGEVDVILTSPPYLNAQTYAKDNWLRLWMLGYDYKELQHCYLTTSSVARYSEMMVAAFKQLAVMMKPGGRLICVAGDVTLKYYRGGASERQTIETGTLLADICESADLGLRVVTNRETVVSSHARYYHALSGSNGHTKRDLIERVFVAEKIRG